LALAVLEQELSSGPAVRYAACVFYFYLTQVRLSFRQSTEKNSPPRRDHSEPTKVKTCTSPTATFAWYVGFLGSGFGKIGGRKKQEVSLFVVVLSLLVRNVGGRVLT